jgi:Dyp-type peroxidase family
MGGLRALGLETESLASFPPEFQAGMRARASLLGDFGAADPDNWDEPWRSHNIHLVLMCYSDSVEKLDAHSEKLRGGLGDDLCELSPAQDAGLLTIDGARQRIEHFGFLDGVSNPDVEELPVDGRGSDTGNFDDEGNFRKVRLGEFLLGHRGEGDEVPPMPRPPQLVYNGTFLVMRKLEQDVIGFRNFVSEQAATFSKVIDQAMPPGINHKEYFAAKMMGRWRDGSPLDVYPEGPADHPTNAFSFADDVTGARCPVGAHVRRANPRASLGFGGNIVSRRRIMRRGIAYGDYVPEEKTAPPIGDRDTFDKGRGIMFLAFNASIERQFEFLQSQWLNNGDEFRQGDDTDPIAGARYADGQMVETGEWFCRKRNALGRMVIPGDERLGRPPFLCSGIPRFVTTRGGEYFFVPSLTGLRLIASGKVNVS